MTATRTLHTRTAPFAAIQYRCRDNEPGERFATLLYIYPESRRVVFCPTCAAIKLGLCVFNAEDHKCFAAGEATQAQAVCSQCHRPNAQPAFRTCPKCLAKASVRQYKYKHKTGRWR